MHILYLSSPGGGLETNVRLLAPALVAAGHQVSLLYLAHEVAPTSPLRVTPQFPTYFARVNNLHYYTQQLTPARFGLGSYIRLYEIASAVARAVHMIHQHTPLDIVELPEIVLPRQTLQVPFVARLHSAAWTWRETLNEPPLRADAWEKKLEGQTLARAAAVSSPSKFVADYVRNACGVTRPIEIIPYPMDTARFQPAPQPTTSKRILFVGRVETRKGADLLLRAVPQILKKHPDAECILAGRVSDELRAMVNAAPPQVKFLGFVPHEELPALYQSAAVVVVPSLWDNSPNVIYEAMACGVPVVASRVGGIPELVEDGVTGWLVPPGDETALEDALCNLLGDSPSRARMGQNGRGRAVENFAVKTILTRTLALYENVTHV